MRVLKFRFYDSKISKKMIYQNPVEAKDIIFNQWENTPKCSPIMQFTGLKDKNGVEIYEGDIVQTSYISPLSDEPVIDVYKVETQQNTLVKLIHSSGLEKWHRYLYLQYKEVAVIGNIYENAELLNA